jgi:hypothetical protein
MKSGLTGVEHEQEIPVTVEQIQKWRDGAHIQNAMPNLSPDQREFLMTGITAEEWDKYVKGPDDE